MKESPIKEYTVTYKNGNTEVFYCRTILEAFCNASLFAIQRAWEPSIELLNADNKFNIKNPSFTIPQDSIIPIS